MNREQNQAQSTSKILAAIYIVLMFISYISACYRLPTGVMYMVNLAVVGMAFAVFLVRPDFQKALCCLKFFALNYLPYFVFWIWSLVLWIREFQSVGYILRGSANTLYMATNIACLCAAVYLFGRKALFYMFAGMAMANLYVLVSVAASQGAATVFQEYVQLVTSFAASTGSAIGKLELHDMVYGWGGLVVYFLLCRQKKWRWNIAGALVSLFFFTLAFKRIGILAVAAGIVLGLILMHVNDKKKKILLAVFALTAAALAFLYLYLIKTGIFYELCERFGINLMHRDVMYKQFEDFYELSPGYLGQGIRFIKRFGTENHTTDTIHNVFLELYLETGFWSWFFWLFYDLYYRVRWIGTRYSWKAAGFQFAINGYMFITYMTDNTFFHNPINMVCRMAVMVYCLDCGESKRCLLLEHEQKTQSATLPEAW